MFTKRETLEQKMSEAVRPIKLWEINHRGRTLLYVKVVWNSEPKEYYYCCLGEILEGEEVVLAGLTAKVFPEDKWEEKEKRELTEEETTLILFQLKK